MEESSVSFQKDPEAATHTHQSHKQVVWVPPRYSSPPRLQLKSEWDSEEIEDTTQVTVGISHPIKNYTHSPNSMYHKQSAEYIELAYTALQ